MIARISIVLLLLGCDYDNRLWVIEAGQNEASGRGLHFVGETLSFDFMFENYVQPKDSAIHKLYGASDGDHRENSARLAFRFRKDKSIDIFAYSRIDSKLLTEWMGNVQLRTRHHGLILLREFYGYSLDGVTFTQKGRIKHKTHYGLFPYYEDKEGNGPSEDLKIHIHEN